jgi:hypothetical protein
LAKLRRQSERKKAEWTEEGGGKHEKVKELEKGEEAGKRELRRGTKQGVFNASRCGVAEAIALAQGVLEGAKPEQWTS